MPSGGLPFQAPGTLKLSEPSDVSKGNATLIYDVTPFELEIKERSKKNGFFSAMSAFDSRKRALRTHQSACLDEVY